MARPDHLFVFCYDVSRDGIRARVANLFESNLARVQKSVFEGYMTMKEAQRLSRRAAALIGPEDSLRVYCITEDGRRKSQVHGMGTLAEANDFWLL